MYAWSNYAWWESHVCVVSCSITDVILHTVVYMVPARAICFPLLEWQGKKFLDFLSSLTLLIPITALRAQVDMELHKWVHMITESASHPSENRMSVQSGDLHILGSWCCAVTISSHQVVEEVLEAWRRDVEVKCQAKSAHNPTELHLTCWITGMMQRSK